MVQFSKKIIDWYHLNHRDLPWRNQNDPYKIWLSEIILQQTQVKQGMSYYLAFVNHYPTVVHLARANPDEVMKLWQGLGYYSRARNLHQTAKTITDQHKGVFPNTHDLLLKLKGIGSYTAAAIASFAFGEARAVVDGNVYRVLSRVFGIETPIDSTEGKKRFQALADGLLDATRPADFNQAIMEFGAMQCRPKKPACNTCIFEGECVAFGNNLVSDLPVKTPKPIKKERHLNYLVFEKGKMIYLKKRIEKDIWSNLFDFYWIEIKKTAQQKEICLHLHADFEWIEGKDYTLCPPQKIYKHTLTHQTLFIQFWAIDINQNANTDKLDNQNLIPFSIKDLQQLPIPKPIDNYFLDRKIYTQ